MTPEDKFDLITRNLQEVVGEKELKDILKKRDLKVYWGASTTGRPHVGYFVPIFKIRDLLNAGCHITLLMADVHAFLDNMKSTWEQLEKRTQYYEFAIKEMLKSVGADIKKLTFVKGSSFQFREDYTTDMYKISALASTRDTKKAGAEVVKQSENAKMSGLLYPILQSLDEIYLKVDAQFGGVDQRKIFMFAREFLPAIGYSKQIHLMNPMMGSVTGGKMSASDEKGKIDLLDDAKTVSNKLKKGFCEAGNPENWYMDFSKLVVFPHLGDTNKNFVIDRPEKFGGPLKFGSYDEMLSAFVEKELHPMDLKSGVTDYINTLLEPIRKAVSPKVKKLIKEGYD